MLNLCWCTTKGKEQTHTFEGQGFGEKILAAETEKSASLFLFSGLGVAQDRVAADVWETGVWEFQAKSGSSGSCRLFLHFLGKITVRKMYGKTPGSPRHPSSRHPRPSEKNLRFMVGRAFVFVGSGRLKEPLGLRSQSTLHT